MSDILNAVHKTLVEIEDNMDVIMTADPYGDLEQEAEAAMQNAFNALDDFLSENGFYEEKGEEE